MNELLIELKERLNQIAITGLKSVTEDFRLKKLYEKFNAISKKSNILSKISELISQLIETDKNNICIIYLELVNLTDAVLYTQGISSSSEKETDIKILENIIKIAPITYSQIANIRNILDSKTYIMWHELKNFYEEKNLIDYRLLDDFLSKLGNSYMYEEDFGIVTILSAYGENIVPLLLERFDKSDSVSKSNIIKIISEIGKEKYNNYYIKCIEENDIDSVIVSAIEALKHDKNNKQYLLAMKTKRKKIQQAKNSVLEYMESQYFNLKIH